MLNNLSKEPLIPFIGTVVKFENQKEQVEGVGWGWRYKIAIFDAYSPQDAEIADSNIEYAIAMLGNCDGSGAADHRRSVRISQGDTVVGFKYGGKRGISIIFGVFPRTKNTVFGDGRFDAKSGYYGNDQPKGLMGRTQEHNENSGHVTPETTNNCANHDKSKSATKKQELFDVQGLSFSENMLGQYKKPRRII